MFWVVDAGKVAAVLFTLMPRIGLTVTLTPARISLTYRRPSAMLTPFAGAAPAAQVLTKDERELDKAVERINRLKTDLVRNSWELGAEIQRVFEEGLWKQRRDSKQRVRYLTWKQFCVAELKLSHMHVYRLVRIAQAFTRADVEKLGVAKLGIALQVPEPFRAKLIEKAKAGASAAALEREVRASKKVPTEERDKKALTAAKKQDGVTVAVLPGRVTLTLWKRPKKTGDTPVAARKLTDDPWASEPAANNVSTYYFVRQNPAGEMVLVIERRRNE